MVIVNDSGEEREVMRNVYFFSLMKNYSLTNVLNFDRVKLSALCIGQFFRLIIFIVNLMAILEHSQKQSKLPLLLVLRPEMLNTYLLLHLGLLVKDKDVMEKDF